MTLTFVATREIKINKISLFILQCHRQNSGLRYDINYTALFMGADKHTLLFKCGRNPR